MSEPAPTDDPTALFAQTLLEIRQDLRVLKPWMDETDQRLEGIARSSSTGLEEVQALSKNMTLLYGRVDQIEQTLGGVAELAKSTFDIVTALKEIHDQGGEPGKPAKVAAQ